MCPAIRSYLPASMQVLISTYACKERKGKERPRRSHTLRYSCSYSHQLREVLRGGNLRRGGHLRRAIQRHVWFELAAVVHASRNGCQRVCCHKKCVRGMQRPPRPRLGCCPCGLMAHALIHEQAIRLLACSIACATCKTATCCRMMDEVRKICLLTAALAAAIIAICIVK